MAKKATSLSSLRSIRTVGSRQTPQSVDGEGLSESQIQQWLQTGVRPDDDEHISALELAADAIERLSPSSFATFTALRDAIPADVRDRIIAGRHLCLIARLPSKDWITAARHALTAAIQNVAADAGVQVHTTVSVCGIERRYGREGFSVDDIVQTLHRQHVIVPLLPDEVLGFTLPALADLELCLYPTPETLIAAVRRCFPDATEWPDYVSPQDVKPASLDLACQRGASADHAFALLERLSAAEAEEHAEKISTAVKKFEDEKTKKTAASKPAAISPTYPTSPKLEELHGYGSIAAWAQDLCADLAAYKNGDLDWADVDTGCLIYGPPGTGKTLFASALAASSGLPFFATSFAQWQGARGGHLGDVVQSLREWFAAASRAAPAILFIDEFDSIPSRGGSKEHDDYWTPIVNALLEVLDGTARREGLVVIAACNHPNKIDPAIVRSGRLDRRFELGLPEEEDLVRIFGHHLPGLGADVIEPVATVLAGSCSGADVARIAREARRSARREKRDLDAADLLAIAMPEDTRSPLDRRLIAVHEAGHAIASIVSGNIPVSMSIVRMNGSHGAVTRDPQLGVGRAAQVESEVVILLAGRAAEEVILGEPSAGAEGDLQQATGLMKRVLGTCGLGGRLLHDEQVVGSEVEGRLRDLYGRTLRLVGQHRSSVEALADLALERRVLSRRALASFAEEHGFGEGAR